MNASWISGTGVALVTPFKSDKTIDFAALEKLVDHVIRGGVDFLVALGTTAETPTLSKEEKKEVLQCIIQHNNKRVPLVSGIGGNNTRAVISDFSYFPTDQVDAILSVSPYYNKPTQSGIIEHFKALSVESPKPIILYNVPGRTGSNMLSSTSLQLARACDNIVAIKEASGNMVQCMELIQHKPEGFMVLSGDDNLTLSQIAIGFDGVISVAANCFANDFCKMVKLALNNQLPEARALHYKILAGMDLLFVEGNPAGVKYFLHLMNICENEFRLPVVSVSDATKEAMQKFLKSLS